MSGAGDALLAQLCQVLLAGPRLQLAVLFGSMARGRAHGLSDVDIGIIPADTWLSLADELTLQVELERACGTPVDLVRLDGAPIALRWRVARDGLPLVGAETGAWARFAGLSASEHADIEPALRIAARRFQQRLAAGDAADSE